MKKTFLIGSVVAGIIVISFIYFYFAYKNEIQCGYDADFSKNLAKVGIDACDKTCVNDDDCQPFIGSCININEEPYFPEGLSVAYEAVDCSCVNSACVGKPTGEIAI